MKQFLLILFIAATILACNSNKEKTGTTEAIVLPDSSVVNISSDEKNLLEDTTQPVASNRLIVPGKSVAGIYIDQLNKEAVAMMSPPDMQDAGMGKELSTWYTIKEKDTTDQLNIFFMTNMGAENEASRVAYIRSTSSFFSTSDHIHIGSDLSAIQKHFPAIKKLASYTSPQTNKTVSIYNDAKAGISFEIDDKNLCVGITVQKPGEFANEIYAALFPDIITSP